MSVVGNPIILGVGLSKCSIIVHVDTGSTVGAYSNSAATTLVKTGKEIGTNGSYLISGLETGTYYYVKATKGAQTAISAAITFTAEGVKEVTLSYLVPIEYQAVEYLESTGTQYINTEAEPSQNSGFELEFYTNSPLTSGSDGACLFGTRHESRNNDFQLTTYTESGYSGGTLRLGTSKEYSAYITPQTRQTAKLLNGVYTAPNGNTYNYSSSAFDYTHYIYLFALNERGGPIQFSKTRIYRMKLYTGDTLERDFIPCYRRSDSVAGMWDAVNERFYTNAGTGTFIVGG